MKGYNMKLRDTDKKELWQMTKDEYEKKYGKPRINTTVTGKFSSHKSAVETAVNSGKEVSHKVLKDYPDLKKQTIIYKNTFNQ